MTTCISSMCFAFNLGLDIITSFKASKSINFWFLSSYCDVFSLILISLRLLESTILDFIFK